jgi:hypothetical protein
MTIKEEANKEILWVLRRIQKLIHITPESEYIEFAIDFEKNADTPLPDNQRKALRKIQEIGVIKIKREVTVSPILDSPLFYNAYGINPKKFYLEVIQHQFEELLEKYEMLASQPSNTVEFHYSQKIVSINYGGERYVPRSQEIKRILTEIARHYGDPERSKKPYRAKSLFDDFEYQKQVKKLRDTHLPNINRQLSQKGIPLAFSVVGEGIMIKKDSPDIKIEFL